MSFGLQLRGIGIGARLAAGFGVIFASMAVEVVGGNFLQQRNTEQLTGELQDANQKEMLASSMQSAILEAAVAARNVGLQGDVAATQREEAKITEQKKNYAEAREQLVVMGLSEEE